MNRLPLQHGSLISLPLMPPWVSSGLRGGVRCEVLGGLSKVPQFHKVEKRLEKPDSPRARPPAYWSNEVCIDTRASCPACESTWRLCCNALHSIWPSWTLTNKTQMFHLLYLPNISCENINLMGASLYPVVPMEIKSREGDSCTLNAPVNNWVAIELSGIEPSHLSPSLALSCSYLFNVTWTAERIIYGS